LTQIADDIDGQTSEPTLFPVDSSVIKPGKIELKLGSCLDILPIMEPNSFSGIITSPPYCNRYDYTRTYACLLYTSIVLKSGATLKLSHTYRESFLHFASGSL